MNSTSQIIDLDFGLSQLSGNRALLLKLLQKFADEYRQLPGTLDLAFSEARWDDARVLVHTLKGVAGNLGCNALFEEARAFENHLKSQASVPENVARFSQVHQLTLSTIDELNGQTGQSGVDTQSAAKTVPPQALLSALKQHEFIPQSQLDDWLGALNTSAAHKEAIRDAIDELDYEQAIELIER
ncbi:Hpt domain-containing protein [Salinimonas marina]|uniref:Hpt domain-containing protein n=1 Tax=Salinimonas marina TaxID=2785918 RepID=A0A7S9HCU7_9ALTE|nr:Hpt domain-containing protein [Salinimonas marina]QPG04861.1 Hpt domain-containing protein [Salinimonas marina]